MTTYTITLTAEEMELLAHTFLKAELRPAYQLLRAETHASKNPNEEFLDGETRGQAEARCRANAKRSFAKLALFTRILNETGHTATAKAIEADQKLQAKEIQRGTNLTLDLSQFFK